MKDVTTVAGEALAMLALESKCNYHRILKLRVIGRLVEALKIPLISVSAARILRNLCNYSGSECFNQLKGITAAAPTVLQAIMLQENKLQEVMVGLAANIFTFMSSSESRYVFQEAGITEAELAKKLVQILKKHQYPATKVPRIRRFVIELAIWMMKDKKENINNFKDLQMDEVLEDVLETTSELESFNIFSGSVLGKGSLLKMYFFPGQRTSNHIQIRGAPHVYNVDEYPVYCKATPTISGAKEMLNYLDVKSKPGSTAQKVILTDVREEAVVYINCVPFVLRELNKHVDTLKHVGITGPVLISAPGITSSSKWFNMGELSEDGPVDWEGLDASAAHIANLVSTEPPDVKIGIGGLGMGVATALYSATCFAMGKYGNGTPYPINLRAVVGLSGWLPGSIYNLQILEFGRVSIYNLQILEFGRVSIYNLQIL